MWIAQNVLYNAEIIQIKLYQRLILAFVKRIDKKIKAEWLFCLFSEFVNYQKDFN